MSGGFAGTKAPDCVALAAVSDVHASTFGGFTKKVRPSGSKADQVIYASGGSPGFNDAEIEADLDVEYSHAMAPATPIRLYVGAGTNDLQDAISRAVTDNVCGVISISFGYCGAFSIYSGTLDPIFTQAATQGQTVFVSSGDDGAAGLILSGNQCVAGFSPNVSEMSADPNVTCVGGTQFNPQYNSANKDTSTVNDGLDSAWNEAGVGATGGGISTVFARPSWQTGTGVPPGTMRLVPDVALGAALHSPGFYIVAFFQGANRLALLGGTSLSSPAWAGYSRLIGQVFGSGRLGLINPQNLQARKYRFGFGADRCDQRQQFVQRRPRVFAGSPGYDMATGWGSPDMSTWLWYPILRVGPQWRRRRR